MNTNDRNAINSLRRQWGGVAIVAAALLFCAAILLRSTAYAPHAVHWLLISVIVLIGILGMLWRLLPRNHAPGRTELYHTLGAATWLTMLGGTLIAMLAGFLFSPWYGGWLAWAPAVLYLSTRVIDLLDGFIARITNHVSETGSALDIELDGLGLLFAVLLAVQYGRLPVWYMLLAFSRPLFILVVWWRERAGKTVSEMPPSMNRRIIAGCQTGFVAVALWPIVNSDMTAIAAFFFALPLIASFGRDCLVVSNALTVDSRTYARLQNAVNRLVIEWAPFVMRMLVAVILGVVIWYVVLRGDIRIPGQSSAATLLFLLISLPFIMGIAGRTASVGLLLYLLVYPWSAAVSMQIRAGMMLMLAASTLVLHVGSGRWSLWRPEEQVVHGRWGRSADERE